MNGSRRTPATKSWMKEYDRLAKWANNFYQALYNRKVTAENIKPEQVAMLREVMGNQVAFCPVTPQELPIYMEALSGRKVPADHFFTTIDNKVYRLYREALEEGIDWVFYYDPASNRLTLMQPPIFDNNPPLQPGTVLLFDEWGKQIHAIPVLEFLQALEDSIRDEAARDNALRDEQARDINGHSVVAVDEWVEDLIGQRLDSIDDLVDQLKLVLYQAAVIGAREGYPAEAFVRAVGANAGDLILENRKLVDIALELSQELAGARVVRDEALAERDEAQARLGLVYVDLDEADMRLRAINDRMGKALESAHELCEDDGDDQPAAEHRPDEHPPKARRRHRRRKERIPA